MREISKDELGQVCGGQRGSSRVNKHRDDDFKLHPVPYRRDGMSQIPTNPASKPDPQQNIGGESLAPSTDTAAVHWDSISRPRRLVRYLTGFTKHPDV